MANDRGIEVPELVNSTVTVAGALEEVDTYRRRAPLDPGIRIDSLVTPSSGMMPPVDD